MKSIQPVSRKPRIMGGKLFIYFLLLLLIGTVLACAGSTTAPKSTAVLATSAPKSSPTPTLMPSPTPSLTDVARSICQGQGIPGATSLGEGSDSIPAIFIANMDGSPNAWNDSLPTALQAKSIDTLEAVLCIGKQEPEAETVGDCGIYTSDSGGGSVDLKLGIYHLDTQLVAASNGKTIVTKQVVGEQATCPQTFHSADPNIVDSVLYKSIGLYDVLNQTLPALIPGLAPHQLGDNGLAESFALSPDASLAATAQFGSDNSIQIWDVKANSQLSSLSGSKSSPKAMAFSPDNKLLASLGDDGELILWDVQNGKLLRRLDRSKKGVSYTGQVAFSSDGKILVSTAMTGLEKGTPVPYLAVWDVESGKTLQSLYGAGVFSLSPVDATLASLRWDENDNQQVFSFWDMNTGEKRAFHRWDSAQYYEIHYAFTADGKQLKAVGLLDKDDKLTGYQLLTLDALTGQPVTETQPVNFPQEIRKGAPILYLADQDILVTCAGELYCNSILFFDLKKSSLLYELKVQGSDAGAYNLVITPDEKYLVTDKLFLWDISWLFESK